MTENNSLENLKFPIGKFKKPILVSKNDIAIWMSTIEKFPERIKSLTENLTFEKLNWVYRPNGWSIKQVVHHCCDSHINCFVRFKLALTENNPTIKPYNEAAWANLIDGNNNDISGSLLIIEGLHKKWSLLLKSLNESDFDKSFVHPDNQEKKSLREILGFYAWHCDHHIAHIKQAIVNNYKF